MKLCIWGAARQVTGSMHLLESNGYKILIDCGLDYEKESRLDANIYFPFDPADIDLVILTHAHIDHSGNLPTLLRMGYEGQIICTAATAELAEILLIDSVNVFAARHRPKGKYRGRGAKFVKDNSPVLFLHKHVMDTAERFVTIPFNKKFKVNENIEVELLPAGHLLGAASVLLSITENDTVKTICFTGDRGRRNYPLLVDPQSLPPVDYLVCEATYGGRHHVDTDNIEEILVKHIQEACVDTPGRLIIPAFSIGRTQSLIYTLNRIYDKGLVPRVKVFVDSPLATLATEIYSKYHTQLHPDAKAHFDMNQSSFMFEGLHFVEDLSQSKEISNYYEPCIIISSAGMLEGGRIRDHLYYNVQNYYCRILFIGYNAKGTLGYKLLRGDPIVHIKDRKLSVFASIRQTDALSGHADHAGLMSLFEGHDPNKLQKTFLVHGEDVSISSLAADIKSKGFNVVIPDKGQVFEL